jgi:hypothetical protein
VLLPFYKDTISEFTKKVLNSTCKNIATQSVPGIIDSSSGNMIMLFVGFRFCGRKFSHWSFVTGHCPRDEWQSDDLD